MKNMNENACFSFNQNSLDVILQYVMDFILRINIVRIFISLLQSFFNILSHHFLHFYQIKIISISSFNNILIYLIV